ncbi:Uncharacterised protein [Mycobacterium tuberculosis]|uniref:Uncharacterized protein n=1 Tax=Mycobacterium tuberculosis TaxID=1773 RepID=A0A916LF12_MYCTX|nr:Uncharacterised protein [Mycobacterium tuberculosis]
MGAAASTEMVLWPGRSAVAEVNTAVSSSVAGVGVDAERISTLVPVLATSMATVPTTVAWGSCNIKPTPFLKLGNGTGSV